MVKKFEVIIIGSGGGAKLAFALANQGVEVALVERDALGGTCLNRGCIPSKMLIHTAEVAETIKRAEKFDLSAHLPSCHFKQLVRRVFHQVDGESQSLASQARKQKNLSLYPSEAAFLSSSEITVNGEILQSEKIVIATGAYPFIPHIPGLSGTPYLTSKTALRLEKQPEKLAIIGGGYIASELGFFFSAIGTDVTLFSKKQILHGEDRDIQREFIRLFGKKVALKPSTNIRKVTHKNGKFHIYYREQKKNHILEADQLLVATGIRGATATLCIENTDIQVDQRGFIPVDERLCTRDKNIWALGDVIGKPFFRHTANFEAEYLEKALALDSKKKAPIHYGAIPYTVFSSPQVAGVGLSEKDLRKIKRPYLVGKHNYADSGRGWAIQPEGGFVKLLFSKKEKKLLGARVIGENASVLCHTLAAFIHMGAKQQDLLSMIYVHPSLAEIIQKAARNTQKKTP